MSWAARMGARGEATAATETEGINSYTPPVPAGYGTIQYTWDSLGRKESMTVPVGAYGKALTYRYIYDDQDEITNALVFDAQVQSSQTTLEPLDQRQDLGKTRFFYDDNGDRVKLITKDGHVFYFVYDPTASVPAVVYEQGPGASGSPASGGRYLNMRYPGGALARRLKYTDTGSDLAVATDRTYHFDGLGSTKALTDQNKVVTDEYSYDEWGAVTRTGPSGVPATQDNPYQYVGELGYYTHYQEPTLGLLQVGVRYYDPQTGRFTQLDPIGDGVNWYQYADGNPVNMVDPSGEGVWKAITTPFELLGRGVCWVASKTIEPPLDWAATKILKTGKAATRGKQRDPFGVGNALRANPELQADREIDPEGYYARRQRFVGDAMGKTVEGVADEVAKEAIKASIAAGATKAVKPLSEAAASRFTRTRLPARTVVTEDGVTVQHYYRGGDHAPPHLHVSGEGPNVRIGQNGKPLAGDVELSPAQRRVIERNRSLIRKAVGKIGRWYRGNQ